MTDALAAARTWLAEDPDPDTRAELEGLLAGGDPTALGDRFSGRLTFGTAGLRGAMGAGPNRMNRATVRYAAAGLATYVTSLGVDAMEAGVVIGYDARHKSRDFALDTAAVLAARGVSGRLLPHALPTPVLAFAVRHLGAAAGVMVTASHNPAEDNGYKVYAGDGAQIVPPVDAEIAAAIAAFTSLGEISLAAEGDPHIVVLDEQIVGEYIEMAASTPHAEVHAPVRIAYTAMHGVGLDTLRAVFARAGLPAPDVVVEQAQPDPDFPTVPFPNPEEPGAMDLVIEKARAIDADVAIANDPDADRVAVAVIDGDGWRRLTGDEVGWLLAEHLLRDVPPPTDDDRRPLVCTTIVSSRLLERMAADLGAHYEETLTGFKWLARPKLARPDLRPVLSYEEALGYAVGDELDKDGITAAVVIVGLAARCKEAGTTIAVRLREIGARYGVHRTGQLALRRDGPRALEEVRELMDHLRGSVPACVGGRCVERVRDHLTDAGRGELPATDALSFELEGDARVVVRPSGTEPKAKVYVEVVEATPERAAAALDALLAAMGALLQEDR